MKLHTLEAEGRNAAMELARSNPDAVILDTATGYYWTGPATLVPVRQSEGSYLCYTDKSFDCAGVVVADPGGTWGAFREGERIGGAHKTLRDAALTLAEHVAGIYA